MSRKGAKSRTGVPGLHSKAKTHDARIVDLEKHLAEALEQQAATSEVLRENRLAESATGTTASWKLVRIRLGGLPPPFA